MHTPFEVHDDTVEVLATLPMALSPNKDEAGDVIVAARQGDIMVTAFHVCRWFRMPAKCDLPATAWLCTHTHAMLAAFFCPCARISLAAAAFS